MNGEPNLDVVQPKVLDADGKLTIVTAIKKLNDQRLPFDILLLEVREDKSGQTIIHIASSLDDNSASYMSALGKSWEKQGFKLQHMNRESNQEGTRVDDEFIVYK